MPSFRLEAVEDAARLKTEDCLILPPFYRCLLPCLRLLCCGESSESPSARLTRADRPSLAERLHGMSRQAIYLSVDDTRMSDSELVSLLRSAMRDLRGDAVAIGAVVGDATAFVWRGSYADEPVHSRTVFYAASVAKQIMGIVAAHAVIRGAVHTDDLVSQWLPELPDWMAAIQLRHLIHHTSDLPDVADPAIGVPPSNTAVIDRFRRLEALDPEPGVQYAYNNAGYILLAEAVSRSLQEPIECIASTEVFIPLTLHDTRLGGPSVPLPGSPNPPGTIGDGGLWTSVHDLTRWLQACNAAAFGAEVHQLAESTTNLADGSYLDYAWGVRIAPSPTGRLITHGGSPGGWRRRSASPNSRSPWLYSA